MENLWIAVITLVCAILFGTFSVITTIIIAVWKITNRFTAIEVRMSGLEQITLAQNHRLEMMETGNFKPIARKR
jgi:hypothetical protein